MATSNPARKQTSPLLALPGELRNKIYAHALHSSSPITIVKTPLYTNETRWTLPPLLATCSQLHREAGDVYFGTNSFSYYSCGVLTLWLKRVPRRWRGQIRRLLYDDGCARSPEFVQDRLARELEQLRQHDFGVAEGAILVKVVFFPDGGMEWSNAPTEALRAFRKA